MLISNVKSQFYGIFIAFLFPAEIDLIDVFFFTSGDLIRRCWYVIIIDHNFSIELAGTWHLLTILYCTHSIFNLNLFERIVCNFEFDYVF